MTLFLQFIQPLRQRRRFSTAMLSLSPLPEIKRYIRQYPEPIRGQERNIAEAPLMGQFRERVVVQFGLSSYDHSIHHRDTERTEMAQR
jgi:hypothetical protein